MIVRMYEYRLYPSGKQKLRIIDSLKTCKIIYNELVALSIDAYRFGKISLNVFDFNKYLTGKYPEIHSQIKQNVSDRVYKAFSNFFRRVKDKSCKNKGFPRFKSRVNSLTFPQSGFKILSDKRIMLSKIGNIPVILHRVPKGKIKTLTIKQNKAGQWFAIFSCELPDSKAVHASNEKVGVDVGLENFVTLSNGEVVANPRYLTKSEKKLELLQKRVSRKVKGSNNRNKARFRLAKQYIKVTNQRNDFLHKLSKCLTIKYSFIAVEDLNINSMLQNNWLAKKIGDASWNTFIQMLSYKAVTCGGRVIKNPRTKGSSHRCSKCGFYIENMPLNKRVFECPKCLNFCHRDLNASINHLNDTVGLTGIYTPADTELLHQKSSVASLMVEAGTTHGT